MCKEIAFENFTFRMCKIRNFAMIGNRKSSLTAKQICQIFNVCNMKSKLLANMFGLHNIDYTTLKRNRDTMFHSKRVK